MKKAIILATATVLGLLSSAQAQTTIFNDNFQNGSTVNGTSIPGGTPSASSTSYDIASSKTGQTTLNASGLEIQLSSATTSGFWEAQAVFSSTPVTLATIGDYINMTYTFTDTANLLGTTNSAIYNGLYDDAGTTPVAGGLASSGLSTTNGSSFATGNAASWSGYAGRFMGTVGGTGSQQLYTRPVQNGAGTTSANQDLIGNNFGSGAYKNPTGTTGTGNPTSPLSSISLTTGSQYTISYLISLSAANTLTVSENFYTGVDTTGSWLGGVTNSFASATDTSFDGLAIGARNAGTSLNPEMTISDINITDSIQAVPEPATFAIAGIGLGVVAFARRFRRQ